MHCITSTYNEFSCVRLNHVLQEQFFDLCEMANRGMGLS